MEIILETCAVRSWRTDDAPALARHANNRKIWLNMRDAFPHPYTIEDANAWISGCLQREPETCFALDLGGEAVGSIGFMPNQDVERISAEIGYWLAEPFWGRGIVTEALVAVTDHALATLPLERIYAVPYASNPASFRVLEKAGYTLEARLRKSAIKDGRVLDQLIFARVTPD